MPRPACSRCRPRIPSRPGREVVVLIRTVTSSDEKLATTRSSLPSPVRSPTGDRARRLSDGERRSRRLRENSRAVPQQNGHGVRDPRIGDGEVQDVVAVQVSHRDRVRVRPCEERRAHGLSEPARAVPQENRDAVRAGRLVRKPRDRGLPSRSRSAATIERGRVPTAIGDPAALAEGATPSPSRIDTLPGIVVRHRRGRPCHPR